mgnify:CR=1 FL=1
MNNSVINVAIDGPAGAGKSTISRRAAAELGYIYIDTGALYRTVGLNALRLGVDIQDDDAVISTLTDELKVELKFIDGEQRMFLNDEDVSTAIRTPEASMAASRVSAVPKVRQYLFDLQKNLAKNNNCSIKFFIFSDSDFIAVIDSSNTLSSFFPHLSSIFA